MEQKPLLLESMFPFKMSEKIQCGWKKTSTLNPIIFPNNLNFPFPDRMSFVKYGVHCRSWLFDIL